ncbi:acyl-CoA synthetase FdrA [Rhodoferax sp. U2-2l]|uniref:acyl-CoA synthetase FdrA n=1 Tax=Rhodoferax sp. U2-2l TaxID=2884000 RepID=UPI001D0AB5E2|nr:acyl-CoA synthetase FdrA [Rhodoferax sp. U2-2l]MCB8746286.1 acyl-CoA synthetase FdrA [Rhodoferax sp. U2-2l]
MKSIGYIKKNTYFDSVTLMGISKGLLELPGVLRVSVSMGTEMNKQLLADGGFDTRETMGAEPNDVMIVIQLDDAQDEASTLQGIEAAMSRRTDGDDSKQANPRTLQAAVRQLEPNVAVISLPGLYAAAEARKALLAGLHVMLFSDNVSLEDERSLKELARDKGLLMMGPDCGTSIIGGKALCFANQVERGSVGIVSASGTGAQEISVLLSRAGAGVSQLIGVGGRDLSAQIGGLMMFEAMDALANDPATEVIVLISKPPHPTIAEEIRRRARACGKPVVLCFLGAAGSGEPDGNVLGASTLEAGAAQTLRALSRPVPDWIGKEGRLPADCTPSKNGYVRALFCGGTLTEESRLIFRQERPNAPCFGNTAKKAEEQLADPMRSQAHTFLDMGDDVFTRGKPHPMIDPEVRNTRIVAEGSDPETAVLLLDFVLGYGGHPDPVGSALPAIEKALAEAKRQGRRLTVVAYVLGTPKDPQNFVDQCARLRDLGVLLGETNAHAARLAALLVQEN